jgi:DNA polymerase III epsilon subunit-like protein
MGGISFYIIDTETTGTKSDNQYHEIVEISIVRASDKVQLSRTIKAANPQHASLDALRITNKTIKDLYNGISKIEAINDVNNFFNQDGKKPNARCIVGHNCISFDKRFLHELWRAHNMQFPADLWLDTYKMMKLYIKQKGLDPKTKLSLDESCDLLGTKKIAIGMHTAKIDSRNNFFLYKELVDNVGIDYVPMIQSHPHIIPGLQKFSASDIEIDENEEESFDNDNDENDNE